MPVEDSVAQYEVVLEGEESVLQALARESGLAESVIVDAADKGAVWISRQRGLGRTKPQRLYSLPTGAAVGSTVMLNYNQQVLASARQLITRISDHVNYSIWFKSSGMLCQGSKWSDHTVATRVAADISHQHCFLVHRLDRAACGLMVIAHTKNSLKKLTDLFQQRKVSKTYEAVVTGRVSHTLPLLIDAPVDEREARTTVHSAEYDQQADCSTLRLSIETGRKHQIRKHLSSLGHPIVGDRLYSPEGTVQQDAINLQLVACALEFKCPFSGEAISTSIDASKALRGELLV